MYEPHSDEPPRALEAFGRLSEQQRKLIGLCLHEVVDGPYLPDWEFSTLMGLERAEVVAVAVAWPDPGGAPFTFRAVNNTLNNLLGYPHNHWPQLAERVGADRSCLIEALARWRGG